MFRKLFERDPEVEERKKELKEARKELREIRALMKVELQKKSLEKETVKVQQQIADALDALREIGD